MKIYIHRKQEINKLGMPSLLPFQMNCLTFIVNTKQLKYLGYNEQKIDSTKCNNPEVCHSKFQKIPIDRVLDVSSQIRDYHLLINDLAHEDIKLSKPFQARQLIETLTNSLKDYKNNMKHKINQMSLEDVIIHVRIKGQDRNRDKAEQTKKLSSKSNVVEEKPKLKSNRFKKEKLQDQAQYNKQGSKPNYKKQR